MTPGKKKQGIYTLDKHIGDVSREWVWLWGTGCQESREYTNPEKFFLKTTQKYMDFFIKFKCFSDT